MAGRVVEYASNGQTSQGYLSTPATGNGPGVIVIQEWWGLVPHIKSVADRLAAAGFVALAPDLYHGKQTTEPDEAAKMLMALDIDRVAMDLRGAIDYLLANGGASGERVGVVGFCMGGQLALYAATVSPEKVAATVDFYGVHPNVQPEWSRLEAAVLLHVAEHDADYLKPRVARDLERRLKNHGKTVEVVIYPGTQHAFFNDERPEVYNRPAAEDAWRRTVGFFRQHLG
jgi:carboxymethylenebutenolidase